jgi:eukaryotic-like serine/threonine-protein kinase
MPESPDGRERPRYETLFRLAAGGMATVHVGTARGALGFRQIVAIKRPHAHLADAEFRKAFVTEARLAALLHHANVVEVRDIEVTDDEVSLVMTYVEGASFAELLQVGSKGGPKVTPGIAIRVVLDACAGAHAAHELADEKGRPLHLVHRDISPQNLLVGTDGVARVADFGIAKFKGGLASTSAGMLKGKVAYMAPEYLLAQGIDRRFDVFALGIVLWEGLTGRRLFRTDNEVDTVDRVLHYDPPSPADLGSSVGTALDAVLRSALDKDPQGRFESAAAFAAALEASAQSAGILAGHREVAELVEAAVGQELEKRRAVIRERLASEPSVASVTFDSEPEHDASPGRVASFVNSALSSPKKLQMAESGPKTEARETMPNTTVPNLAPPRFTSEGRPPPASPQVARSGAPRAEPMNVTAPLPQVTQPLPPRPPAPRSAKKSGVAKSMPETLRSEAGQLDGSSPEKARAAQRGAASSVGAQTDPPRRKRKRGFRRWPYVLAVVVGALVGIAFAYMNPEILTGPGAGHSPPRREGSAERSR